MYGHLCVPLLCLSLSLFTRVKRFFASDKSVQKEIIGFFARTPFKTQAFHKGLLSWFRKYRAAIFPCTKKIKGAVAQLMESTDQSDSPFIVAKAPRKMDVT